MSEFYSTEVGAEVVRQHFDEYFGFRLHRAELGDSTSATDGSWYPNLFKGYDGALYFEVKRATSRNQAYYSQYIEHSWESAKTTGLLGLLSKPMELI